MLVLSAVDAGQAIEEPLDGEQPADSPLVHRDEIEAERLRDEKDREREEDDLKPAVRRHVRTAPDVSTCKPSTREWRRHRARRSGSPRSLRAFLLARAAAKPIAGT